MHPHPPLHTPGQFFMGAKLFIRNRTPKIRRPSPTRAAFTYWWYRLCVDGTTHGMFGTCLDFHQCPFFKGTHHLQSYVSIKQTLKSEPKQWVRPNSATLNNRNLSWLGRCDRKNPPQGSAFGCHPHTTSGFLFLVPPPSLNLAFEPWHEISNNVVCAKDTRASLSHHVSNATLLEITCNGSFKKSMIRHFNSCLAQG